MRTGVLLSLLALFTLLVACEEKPEKTPKALPYAGNYDIVTYERNGVRGVDTVYPKIPAFQYLNQDSVMIRSKEMKGKVWIANFFFSNCPSICPPMISQMKRLNTLTTDINKHLQFMTPTRRRRPSPIRTRRRRPDPPPVASQPAKRSIAPPAGGTSPRCRYAAAAAMRPRGVRCR